MTIQEAYNKFSNGCYYTKAEKMQFCEEMGLEKVNKNEEIKRQLLELLREERKTKETYTEEDARNYFRLCDSSSYKKVSEYLKLENRSFVEFLVEYLEKKYKISKIMYNWSLSYSDKYHIALYKSFTKFLNETTDTYIQEQNRIKEAVETLRTQLVPFYEKYMEAGIKIAESIWENQKTHIYEKEKFVEKEQDSRERYYNFSILSLAERLIRNGVDEKTMKVHYVQEDMKLFELTISDNKSTYHARAIIAAEYSEIVSTHIRFIVTKA